MKYTFTRAQIETLDQVLDNVLEPKPNGMYEKLLMAHIYTLWKRIKVKIIDYKKKYSIVIDPATEIAFYLYFQDSHFDPTSYEGNIIKNICDNAEKQYA